MAKPLSLLAYRAFTSRPESAVHQNLAAQQTAHVISHDEYSQRLALDAPVLSNAPVLWLNAGSQQAISPAINLFRQLQADRPDLKAILTFTVKPTVDHAVPDGLIMQHAPDERLGIISRFLAHWTPECLIWIGGGFRPALLEQAKARDIPLISIDAQDNTSALSIPQKILGLRSATMALFDHVFAENATKAMAWRRAGLGTDSIEVLGFLEDGAKLPHVNEDELEALKRETSTRPIWFASQVATGEIPDVIRAHKSTLRRAHRLLLVVSVRDQTTAELIEKFCIGQGLRPVFRDDATPISEGVQVLIVVGSEEDGLWYRLAPVTFLGQSLTPGKGSDPFAAAHFGSAIVHGPNVSDYAETYKRFQTAKATYPVKDCQSLGSAVTALLAPDKAAEMANAAWQVCSQGAEMTDRVAALVHDILDKREETRAEDTAQ
ncbi:3-deoxy-D-manno-octulosonic acid transferase [Pacificibacter maritimus]|nr:glycosyltransferase N-terminal domain-containing protein [Pacificibacter maritimus]